MGRPAKYTKAELKLMRRIWNREQNRRRRAKAKAKRLATIDTFVYEAEIMRPPPEVFAERDYRYARIAENPKEASAGPPVGYSPCYADMADKLRSHFAHLN